MLKNGGSVLPLSVEDLVEKFLQTKRALIRGKWEGKEDAGLKHHQGEVCPDRRETSELPGAVPWCQVRCPQHSSQVEPVAYLESADAAHQDQGQTQSRHPQERDGNASGVLRWGMENGHLPFAPKLPFQDENLVTGDKVRRPTWELNEWQVFARRSREWLKQQQGLPEEECWDAFVAYQMLFFLANCGMRTGELVKVKRKDITNWMEVNTDGVKDRTLCCLVQVHKSNKTGAREVNAMGGVFARRVFERSQHRRKR